VYSEYMPTYVPQSYCEFVADLPSDNVHRIYHDTQYGFLINTDNELFGRLVLEINQAGLSWDTILKKQNSIRTAFENFDINTVANFQQNDIDRLLSNENIIRNKLKINAVIFNAQQIIKIQKRHKSFQNWLKQYQGQLLENWIKLFKSTFKFTGNEITKEFLISTSYLPGAHVKACSINKVINNKLC
jgi:DNA-3-methyladenine glycosylase I